MRHFLPDNSIDEQVLQRLLQTAQSAPSAGSAHEFYPRLMREQMEWRQGNALSAVLMEDGWQGDNT